MNFSYASVTRKFREVPLTVVGIDFRIAPSAMRQKLLTSQEEREVLFNEIKKIDPQAEFMALETCNRVEWIVATVEPQWMSEILKARMMMIWRRSSQKTTDLTPNPFTYTGAEALNHIFNVVVGKESLATGEAQIAGQFHESCNNARQEKSTGPILKRLAVAGGRLAKAGSRTGFRSNQKLGIHGLVSRFFPYKLGEKANPTILVVGMGSIGRKTAQILADEGNFKIKCFNRTIDESHQGKWFPLESLPEHSRDADGLVIATGATQAVLNEDLIPDGRQEPLLVLDIGIPLQVSEGLQARSWVDYNNIDDLMELPGRQEKEPEGLEDLNSEIEKEVELFERFCRERQQQMTLVLSRLHQGRQECIHQHLPALIQENLGELTDSQQKLVHETMKKLINSYAQDIHNSLVEAVNAFGGLKNEQ